AHLLFNLITFYSFAFTLERVIVTARFISLYFCGLLASGIGTCIKHRDEPNYASLGASGAILAVLFASSVYFPRSRLLILPIPIPIPASAVRGGLSGLELLLIAKLKSSHQLGRAHCWRADGGRVLGADRSTELCGFAQAFEGVDAHRQARV